MKKEWVGAAVAAGALCGCLNVEKAEAFVIDAQGSGENGADGIDMFSLRYDTTGSQATKVSAESMGEYFGGPQNGSFYYYDYKSSTIADFSSQVSATRSFVSFTVTHATLTFTDETGTTVQSTSASLPIVFQIDNPSDEFPTYELLIGNDAGLIHVSGSILSSVPLPTTAPMFGTAVLALGGLAYARCHAKPLPQLARRAMAADASTCAEETSRPPAHAPDSGCFARNSGVDQRRRPDHLECCM